MNLPLIIAFTESHRFWVAVFSFSFVSMHILITFLISSVVCWLFRRVLFSLHMFLWTNSPHVFLASCLPLCLQQADGQVCSQLALFGYSLNYFFCEWTRQCLRLELFTGKCSLCFTLTSLSLSLSLWLSRGLVCYLTLASSDWPQGIQVRSLP